MATVQDLVNILDDKLLAYADGALTAPGGRTEQQRKISAINAGKHKVWQLLVGGGRANRANWFAKTQSLSFGIGDQSETLAADFHDLLWAESTSVHMKAASQHRTSWQEDRTESGSVSMTTLGSLYYLVEGDGVTPTLEISRKPSATLSVTAHYTAIVAEWTALTDNIDAIPTPYFDAICNWACSELVNSLHSPEVAQYWFEKWRDDKEMILAAAAHRNLGDVISTEGVDTAG